MNLGEMVRRAMSLAEALQRPGSTYRWQFHAGFTLQHATALLPYLHDLGITHVYASPYFKASPGSQHGYDIVSHGEINPEVGSTEDFNQFVATLHRLGMGQILDTVPNHMGVAGNHNAWWNDVLENGPASQYANYFDIDWHASTRPERQNRLLLPVLAGPYGQVLDAGELKVALAAGAFSLHYFDHCLPLEPSSYARILELALPRLVLQLEEADPALQEFQSILFSIQKLPPYTATDPSECQERQREKEVIKRRLAALVAEHSLVDEVLQGAIAEINGRPGEPASFEMLDQLLNNQAYRVTNWRVAADEINYRRFFDINQLAALSMERPEVFADAHSFVLQLLAEGALQGLRIDHIDGLFDPAGYLRTLQQGYLMACARQIHGSADAAAAEPWEQMARPLELAFNARLAAIETEQNPRWPLYVVVEKILGADEQLAPTWPCDGTSGYEFLNFVNGLFVDRSNAAAFDRLYRAVSRMDESIAEVVYQKKFLQLQVAFASELHMLAHQLDTIAQKSRWSRDFTLNGLRHALREVIACFPVYRSYITRPPVSDADREHIEWAIRRARERNPARDPSAFEFVRQMLLLEFLNGASEADRAEQIRWVGKFQQVTSPVMAKGLEDTAFYAYHRLLALNEVGGDAATFGRSKEEVHAFFLDRAQRWPQALSTLSTHDTKRSEDCRARLCVLSEIPDEWQAAVERWNQLNARVASSLEGQLVPGPNESYLFYQTILAAMPAGEMSSDDWQQFRERIQAYMLKAVREAKVFTSWVNPNEPYEAIMSQFVADVLDEQSNQEFLTDFATLHARVNQLGRVNSLSQTVLKLTAPGVPDTYQGTETWDFSLVDPDNRRPVDYELRQRCLESIRAALAGEPAELHSLASQLTGQLEDPRSKLLVSAATLALRSREAPLFATGDYLPIEASGARQEHAFAFLRRHENAAVLVVVPRLLNGLLGTLESVPVGTVWGDTTIALPNDQPTAWRNIVTGQTVQGNLEGEEIRLSMASLLADFPVGVYVAAP